MQESFIKQLLAQIVKLHRLLILVFAIIFVPVVLWLILSGSPSDSPDPETVLDVVVEPEEPDSLTRTKREIRFGDSIYQVLMSMGLEQRYVGRLAFALGEYVDVTSIHPGDSVFVAFLREDLTPDSLSQENYGRLKELVYKPDLITEHAFRIHWDSISYNRRELPVEHRRRLISGTVSGSLDQSLLRAGLSNNIKQQVNNTLESEISFQTDARNGDIFRVYIEERWFGDVRLPRSRLLYAMYDGRRAGRHEGFRFDDGEESSALNGMYNIKGKTMLHNAVRTPLDYMHVTSPFGRRIHPVHGTWRMHTGIDYRGRTGTPVYAIANGTVISAGRNGGYGKEVQVRHADGQISQYAHLSRIYVRRGTRVRKGTRVGAIGSTGVSTGPHLHFGLKKNGKWINPKRLKMVGAVQLQGEKLASYNQQMQRLKSEVEAYLLQHGDPLDDRNAVTKL